MTIAGLRPLPAGAITAVRLAQMVGEMAADLGIRDEPGAVATEVLAVVGDPLGLYEDHPVWSCLLTDMGVPLELSLKVDAGRRTALRYVTDVTDHRAGLAANWTRYVGYGTTVTSAADAGEGEIWELCRLHLNGVPTSFRSRVMHGQGFAAPDRYRGSIYFRTGWLAHGQLLERFPTVMACLEDAHRRHGTPSVRRIEVLGYDFSPGEPMRTKAYVWPEFNGSDTFDALLGRHPGLDPARSIFESFRSDADAAADPHPLFLQASIDDDGTNQRLFFFAPAWGWDTDGGPDRLLRVLADQIGVGQAPLERLCDVASRHGVDLHLAMVAVGAERGEPSATFYLWPVARRDPLAGGRQRGPSIALVPSRSGDEVDLGAVVRQLLARGAGYLVGRRAADGSWSDYALDARGDVFVTAHVASMLSADTRRASELGPTAEWLLERYHPERGWAWDDDMEPDTETTALAITVLSRAGGLLPAGALDALLRTRLPDGSWQTYPGWDGDLREGAGPPDVSAAALQALLEGWPRQAGSALLAAMALSATQRPTGGWRCFWWSDAMVATWRTLCALRLYEASDFATSSLGAASRDTARAAIQRALPFIAATPAPREPLCLAAWLASWVLAGGDIRTQTVGRVVATLAALQQADGRWHGSPSRLVARTGPDGRPGSIALRIDDASVVTTASVVASLRTLAQAGPSEARS
jgi:hypothetical protein